MDMIWVVTAVLILAASLLLVRVRFRLEIAPGKRLLFLGLGRTGPEFDFVCRQATVRLFGWRLGKLRLSTKPAADSPEPLRTPAEAGKKLRGPGRTRSIDRFIRLMPRCLNALGKYLTGLMKSTVFEQVEGEIEAGFATPDITGRIFGYYQAALAAAPGLFGNIRYYPDWTRQHFSGTVRVKVAWPVYRLVWQTVLLICRLPLREIIKFTVYK